MIAKVRQPVDIRVNSIQDNTVIMTYLLRDRVYLDPDYQRMSDIWSVEKRQLLIDSIINGFDIPKFYLHEYDKPALKEGKKYQYALIDGKQRFKAIWDFIENKYPLAEDIEYLLDPQVKLGQLTYESLKSDHPLIAARFEGRPLSIFAVRTDDPELIEEMFSRLNEAMPLNAPEKRNAFGGPIPKIIRRLVSLDFFRKKLPFSNKRYRHMDLACKFLYLVHEGGPAETKKFRLDDFVRRFKNEKRSEAARKLSRQTTSVVRKMAIAFDERDALLKNPGMVIVYFLLFAKAIEQGCVASLTREKFLEFERAREHNRLSAEKDLAKADYALIKFDELASYSLNDKYAIRFRYNILAHRIAPRLALPGEFEDTTLFDEVGP
jgi:hypothetical protein